jgi:hypothetical protein
MSISPLRGQLLSASGQVRNTPMVPWASSTFPSNSILP